MEASPRLAQLIRERKQDIIAHWKELVRRRPVAQRLPEPYLTDSIPKLLDDLAEAVERGGEPEPFRLHREAVTHARERLGLGYEIGQLVGEYSDLREALFASLAGVAGDVPLAAWRAANCIIDITVGEVMERFSRAREQKLRAFERVSSEPLTASSLETLLTRLLDVMVDVAPEVDTVTILLREGNALHVRASRGLEAEIRRGFSLAIGDGFAGTIAALRQPVLLHDAMRDPMVKSDDIRARGLRALYGVPLVDEAGDLVGVAHMGSTSAHDFQEEDLILFRGLANRATALIASRRAADRLLRDERQRETFIGILGHDLRQPLQAVVGSAHMLLQHGRLEERDRRVVLRIARASDRMKRLIGDILDFARARLGEGIPLSKTWVDVGEVVRTSVEEVELAYPGRTVQVRNELRSRVCCDADRVSQVVSNLVSNALKHGAADAPVDVRIEDVGEDAVITVHNGGTPIRPELLPHVFEPFRRGDAEPAAHGVGLGLFIADAITLAHGGSIEARSEERDGTTFTVRLPKRGVTSRTPAKE